MKTNVGSYDAAVRFVAGCGILMAGNHGFGWWGWLGLIPILSASTGFCAIYAIFRLDTSACDRVDDPDYPTQAARIDSASRRIGGHVIPIRQHIRHS